MMILVVGATGQLGTAVVRKSRRRGCAVRALVRSGSAFDHLREDGVEIALGDLRDAESVAAACRDVDVVISTATVVFPRGPYAFEEDEGRGYRNLVSACRERGVRQLIFVSNLGRYDERTLRRVPTFRFKLEVEQLLEKSGLRYTIFRSAPFMDDYFALMGSRIPLRGAEAATLRRPFWMSRVVLAATGGLLERRGIAPIPGPLRARHAYIALDDVAEYLVRAVDHPAARNARFEIGGPESQSWSELAELYARLLGRRVVALPWGRPWLLLAGCVALRRLSPAAANQLGILWLLADQNLLVDARKAAEVFGVEPTRPEAFLRAKLELPES